MAAKEPAPRFDYLSFLKRRWTSWDFINLVLFLGILGTLAYFYGGTPIYDGDSIYAWALKRYQPGYNFEHGKWVPLIFLVLVGYHWEELARARKQGSNLGIVWVIIGCMIFAAGARTLQGRVGLAAAPFLLYGTVLFLWGKEVARILLFPIAFLFFMIPLAAIEQSTFKLQFMVTGISQTVCGLIGIPLYVEGTTLRPVDQSFHGFNVAEGCSGINSLMAMVMVTAIFVHLTQNKLWKQIVILLFSTVFAIIGNAGRITSIFIVAKFFGADFAGGAYHEVSGYVSFPIALVAMLMMSRLLDLPFFEAAKALKTGQINPDSTLANLAKKDTATYDY